MKELINNEVDFSQAKCATKSDAWEIFFPEGKDVPAKTSYAKALCGQCPVAVACFISAMAKGDDLHGIWGKTTPAERKYMRKDINMFKLHIKSISNQTAK
jgi:WhiB family redox-sensing transcriptional regulator